MSKRSLTIATTNPGKEKEIREALRGLGLKVTSLNKVNNLKRIYPERGKTFSENAIGKALYYSKKIKGYVLAEDSGLEVDCLNGAPGVYSARFSGPRATDEKNIKKLLRLLHGVSQTNRKARFVCVMVLAENSKIIKEIKGEVHGRITNQPRGVKGFGYDPVFFYPKLKKTFAELSSVEKNSISHRGRALSKLRTFLARKLNLNNRSKS